MFVAIENEGMNAFQVDGWIKRARNENGGLISPKLAVEVLSKTNHFANIKMLMKNINKLPDEEKKKYKDFVLACVDCREQTPETMETLRSLADVCGVLDEFEEVNKKSKIYDEYELGKTVVVKSVDEFKKRRCGDLRDVTDLKIYFDCDEVSSLGCDFDNVVELRFAEGTDVQLKCAKNLPSKLDVSKCSKVNLSHCNLLHVTELSFAEGAEVDLSHSTNMPSKLDVSRCSKVYLYKGDLLFVGKLSFAEGAEVNLESAINITSQLDVSKCSKVNLYRGDLIRVKKELKFREGAEVDLRCTSIRSEVLDVSMCSKVDLRECDLSNVRELKFKDKRQKNMASKSLKGFNGKISYEGDDAKKNNVWYSKLQDFLGKRRM